MIQHTFVLLHALYIKIQKYTAVQAKEIYNYNPARRAKSTQQNPQPDNRDIILNCIHATNKFLECL